MRYLLLWLLLSLVVVFLNGCSAMDVLNPFGGGTDVNANAQIGAENTQQIVANQSTEEINANSVIQNTIQDIPPWVMILLILGWLLPSPQEIFHGILYFIDRLLGRKK